jgi:hypothetical protein
VAGQAAGVIDEMQTKDYQDPPQSGAFNSSRRRASDLVFMIMGITVASSSAILL